jgi:hypothetical protein
MSNDPVDVFQYYDMTAGSDACWPYIGNAWGGRPGHERRPYFMAAGRRQIAYRWIYELVHGVILEPTELILHACDCGAYPIGCGNPRHMRIGTHQENMDDMTDRQRHGMPKTVVRAIRRLLDEGRTQQDIADMYGIARETVSAIATQRSHKNISD